ncbi:hypothetical protein GC173_18820 [bacterium]|nr:hypothetical protein [bacterium]
MTKTLQIVRGGFVLPALFLVGAALALPTPFDQDRINAGEYTLAELFHGGAQLFSHRMTREDGLGEAPDGPRRSLNNLADNRLTPFLRINGLDATSCQECHFQIGQERRGGFLVSRDMGTLGGSAGIAGNVMIFPNSDDMRTGFVRNPPHLFGVGYIQRLADEMTEDLRAQAQVIRAEAIATQADVRRELVTKGISFGYLTGTPIGAVDRSELRGVSIDFVVRPFQFKGIASSLRSFVAGALNFHFSIQPRELIARNLIPNDNPNGTLADDRDVEIEDGDVTAIAAFLSMLRPPMESSDGLDAEAVIRGRELFATVGCAECHVPALPINDSRLTLVDGRARQEYELEPFRTLKESTPKTVTWITAPERDSKLLDSVLQADHKGADGERLAGLTFDLSNEALPDEALPRIRPEADGTVLVPLFSDLRRHQMGADLADTAAQVTDAQSITVLHGEFLTRPLWGVADTGPWLHDGRATTLNEAILMHDGEGSEARLSIQMYRNLSAEDQRAVVEFLRSLRIRPMAHTFEPGVRHRSGLIAH